MNTIYKITNTLNGKIYIGFTTQKPEARFNQHCSPTKPKYQSRSVINQAILKYGRENFTFEILFQSEDYDLTLRKEQEFILSQNSLTESQGGYGYNVDKGGNTNKRSPETIEKHRAKMLGVKKSDEHINNFSKAKSGVNNPMYGKSGELSPQFGLKRSDETKKKMSEAKAKSRLLREQGILPPITRQKGIPLSDSAKQKLRDAKKSKYINVKIEGPDGTIYDLPNKEEIFPFMKDHKLNNFFQLITSGKRDKIKGYSLVAYEINPDY